MNSSSSRPRYWYDGLPEATVLGISLLAPVVLFSLEPSRYRGVPDEPTVAAPVYGAAAIVSSSTHTDGAGGFVWLPADGPFRLMGF